MPVILCVISVTIALLIFVFINEGRDDEEYKCYIAKTKKEGKKLTYRCEGVGERRCKHCLYYKQYIREVHK